MNISDLSAVKTYNLKTLGDTILVPPIESHKKLVLIAIIINTKGASSNVIKIYDSTEAIGKDPNRLKATLDTATSLGRFEYGFPCFDGIYLSCETGTAPDVTVIYADTQ